MDVGAREMKKVKTLLSGNRDIMTSLSNEEVSSYQIGAIPCLAAFDILAAFKDNQLFKEGQLPNCLSKMWVFRSLLDYTSDTLRWFIWGGNIHRVPVMAILWLKKLSRQFPKIIISLITLHLQDIMLFEKHRGRFGDLCLALNKAGNR